MMDTPSFGTRRILSIALASRRLGFVVCDKNINIRDYGTRAVRGSCAEKAKQKVKDLIEEYQPHFICIQDIQDSECKLGHRVKTAVAVLEEWLVELGISLKAVSKSDVWHSLGLQDGSTRESVVGALLEKHPQIRSVNYTRRKLWEPEHWNAPIFLALSFVSTLH